MKPDGRKREQSKPWTWKKNTVGTIQLSGSNPTNEAMILHARAFAAHVEALGHCPETVRKRWDGIRKFLCFLEARKIERIQEVDLNLLDDYRLCLIEHAYSDNTIHSEMHTVRLFYKFMEDKNEVFDNPAQRLRIPKPPVVMGTVLTESEMQRMLAIPNLTRPRGIRDRALLETLYSTGIRLAELVGLTVFDVDLERATLRVKGKGRKERIVPLGKEAVKFLGIYLKEARPKFLPKFAAAPEALWMDRSRTHMQKGGTGALVARYGKEAGIDKNVTAHVYRRTFATLLLRNGAHPVVVAQLLGHTGLQSLAHYLQTTITDLMKAHAQTNPGK